jgi:hypothetical protein
MTLKIDMPRMNSKEDVVSVCYVNGSTIGIAKWVKVKGKWTLTNPNVDSNLEKRIKEKIGEQINGKAFIEPTPLIFDGFFND